MDLNLIIIVGVILGCFVALSWFAGSDAPFVPTKKERIKKVLKLVGLKKGDIFWELGSGDGRIVLEATRMGATAYGIEQSWIRVIISRWKAHILALHLRGVNVKFIHGNIFHHLSFPRKSFDPEVLRTEGRESINNADVVFVFLLPKGVARLEPILKRNLKKGAKVITQTFHFKNWKPYKKVLITDNNQPNTLLGKNKYEGEFWYYRS